MLRVSHTHDVIGPLLREFQKYIYFASLPVVLKVVVIFLGVVGQNCFFFSCLFVSKTSCGACCHDGWAEIQI